MREGRGLETRVVKGTPIILKIRLKHGARGGRGGQEKKSNEWRPSHKLEGGRLAHNLDAGSGEILRSFLLPA
jgi:hypothetical protein